ncbi:hypothetical protein BDB00DRAFT_88895, partial [Zychaea mexicana]|uniref:uncharacterized protein n=1 Tax=Zychaea mexicana TaxID=64656 RepID=UPI0022FE751A
PKATSRSTHTSNIVDLLCDSLGSLNSLVDRTSGFRLGGFILASTSIIFGAFGSSTLSNTSGKTSTTGEFTCTGNRTTRATSKSSSNTTEVTTGYSIDRTGWGSSSTGIVGRSRSSLNTSNEADSSSNGDDRKAHLNRSFALV